MYHKVAVPVGAVAAGGGLIGNSVWMIVAGSTLAIAGLAIFSLMPKLRSKSAE
jgi:uncharacterized membrane protein YccF (DUF307 family)